MAACEKHEVDCGYAEADANYRHAMDVADDILQQLIEAPAYTFQGMLVKVRLAPDWGKTDDCLEFLEADLSRMVGEAV
jgi:hypothetical protein